jgi:hypothetical protein
MNQQEEKLQKEENLKRDHAEIFITEYRRGYQSGYQKAIADISRMLVFEGVSPQDALDKCSEHARTCLNPYVPTEPLQMIEFSSIEDLVAKISGDTMDSQQGSENAQEASGESINV